MERQSPNSEMQQEALLKFSINNILRPDFGSSGPPSTDLTSPVSNFLSPTMMYVQAAQQLNALTAASNLIKSFSTNDFLTSARALQVLTTTSESIQQKSEQASPSPILASPSIQKTKLSPSSPEPTTDKAPSNSKDAAAKNGVLWPAWVYCTRYSDRPSSGKRPRCRKIKRRANADEKRPRTAFTSDQLSRLKDEFQQNRYLTEKRRQDLANELGLKESQIKIWFQNKRAKIKKQVGVRNPLAMQLMSQGLYNHATIPVSGSEEEGSEMIKDME